MPVRTVYVRLARPPSGSCTYTVRTAASTEAGAFYFLILKVPVITVGGTGVLAALIARQRTQMLAAVMAALLGHVVGIIIMFAYTAPPMHGFLGYVLDVAPAALYASAAAAIAATAGSRRR